MAQNCNLQQQVVVLVLIQEKSASRLEKQKAIICSLVDASSHKMMSINATNVAIFSLAASPTSCLQT
jgi:hypothetical protein